MSHKMQETKLFMKHAFISLRRNSFSGSCSRYVRWRKNIHFYDCSTKLWITVVQFTMAMQWIKNYHRMVCGDILIVIPQQIKFGCGIFEISFTMGLCSIPAPVLRIWLGKLCFFALCGCLSDFVWQLEFYIRQNQIISNEMERIPMDAYWYS